LAPWKGILIKNITKQQQYQHFFTWGHSKWNNPKIVFSIIFKLGKLVEDYHLLLPSIPLEGVD
jgi:hypothetical protein